MSREPVTWGQAFRAAILWALPLGVFLFLVLR